MSDNRKRALYGLLGTLGMVTVLALVFAAVHWAAARLYLRLGWQPPALVGQVLNSLLGLFVFVALMITIMHLFRSKRLREQMKIIAPILEALQTIARGNFDVQIEHDYCGHEVELFSELVTGVNSMAQQLKQMEEMRQEFISNVSHEIQSPLTSIRGFAQALQNEQLSTSERSHYLAIIETESTRLSKLSDNLLSLAALDAKTVQPDCKAFRLDKQIRGLILACEPQWSAKQIDMTLTADEILFSGDENLLSQVWVNLLHNAIKFTSDNGSISVALHGCQDAVEFRIADSGIGIAPAAQERLFERFFKADTARNRAVDGSGLGLAIAKQVVELHRGQIGVESTLGAGATFTVQLPIV
ncbi:MAG: HAMP domain-containing sensor histidine kinase [Caldilineaceae bacterium]